MTFKKLESLKMKERKENRKKKKYTRRQWYTLVVIGGFHFSSAICISLQAPFYPLEAESKGVIASEYGLVFGSFELIAFLTSPLFGKYLHTLGAKFCLNIGILLASVSAISFGLLDLVQNKHLFLGLSFFLRITESLGSTAALVAAFSITAAVFQDNVATIFATMETFYGLGYIVGPTLGGLIFTVGGYMLPFIVMGVTMLLVGAVTFCILPSFAQETKSKEESGSMLDILKIPSILLDALCIVGSAISMGFYASTLEPHIREFKLTPVYTSLMFILSGGTYAICAPFVGRLCDKIIQPKLAIAFGSLMIITSYTLVGPFPFLPIPKTLGYTITGLIIHGLGLAGLMAPSFISIIRTSVDRGFPDDLTTYGLVSGLWSSSFALGAFVGPSISGLLFDLVGFSYGTLFVIAVHTVLLVLTTCFLCFHKDPGPHKRIRIISGCESSTSDDEVLKPADHLLKKPNYGATTSVI